MDISEIIQSHYHSLTKKQRLIADYILENPMEVCYISLSDLSGKTGCSELTVLKFCKALGFTGFIDLKKAFRTCHERMDVLDGSFSRPDEADECSDLRFLQKQCDSQMKNISRFYAQVNLDEVSNIAQALTSRRILYVFAHDTARIFASYLCERLLAMEFTVVPVNLSDTQQIEKAFNNMDQKDAAILFSFPNYFFSIGTVARIAAEKCGRVILFTNESHSPAAPYAMYTVVCQTETEFFHNFWCTPVAYISLLTDCLLRHLPEASYERK